MDQQFEETWLFRSALFRPAPPRRLSLQWESNLESPTLRERWMQLKALQRALDIQSDQQILKLMGMEKREQTIQEHEAKIQEQQKTLDTREKKASLKESFNAQWERKLNTRDSGLTHLEALRADPTAFEAALVSRGEKLDRKEGELRHREATTANHRQYEKVLTQKEDALEKRETEIESKIADLRQHLSSLLQGLEGDEESEEE